MKKNIKFFVAIIIIFVILLLSIKYIKKEHFLDYKISNYTIKEHFYIREKSHYYDFLINNKNNSYTITLNKKLNKAKKIIKNIKTYKEKDLECIVPTYKKKIQNNIYCTYKNKAVSNNILLDNEDFKKILNKAKIKINKPKDSKINYKNLTIFKENISDNYKYIIWDYKGIYIISKNKQIYQKILNKDLYDNIMSTVVDKYFVLFDNTSVNGIETIYYYDLVKNKLKSFKLEDKISKDSYINGVFNNLIYITDKKEKKQYTLNIKKKKIEDIFEKENQYLKYENYKLKTFSKSDFFMTNQYFNNENIKDKNFNYEEIRKEYNYYYYLENNKIYKAIETNKKNSILLLTLPNIKDWKVIDEDIFIINEDTLYHYNEQQGLRKIIKSNELKYNYKNIYYICKR